MRSRKIIVLNMKIFCLLLLLLSLFASVTPQPAKTQSTTPNTGMLRLKDGSIYYETLGKGAALVLIHGGYGDRRMWDGQFQALANDFRVIRYDHRGFGRSTAPRQNYSPVKDLLRLFDSLKVKRAHLVGNSLGGSLAIDFTLKHPERVASLVVVASGPNGVQPPQEAIDRIVAVFKAAETQGPEKAAEMWLAHPMVAISSAKPGARELLRTMVTDNQTIFRLQHWPTEEMKPLAAQRLKEIKVPTLIVIGGQDTEDNRQIGELAAKEIAGARRIVMADGDHLPQMVNPAEFNRNLLLFLKSL
jgi:pimeloyl-ACP methyl ester carboxylesterase